MTNDIAAAPPRHLPSARFSVCPRKGFRTMGLPLSEIARLIDGNLTGNADLIIDGAATLPVARPGEITLADHPKLAPQLARCQASAVIVPATFQPTDRPIITVAHVHAAFAKIVVHFRPPRQTRCPGVSPAA